MILNDLPMWRVGGGRKKEHPYFKGAKVQGEHTCIITHWDNMFEGEREKVGVVSTHGSCGGDEKAVQPPQLLLWKTFLVCFSIYS